MALEHPDDRGDREGLRELALFTGAGGGILGTMLLGFKVVCGVEIDPYCREVLLRRQEEGFLEAFPIWDDVRTFVGRAWRGKVDVVTGGFPCQPFSTAGKQLGEDDPRNLWPETIRIIREVGPRFCLLENVPALLAHKYFGTILGQLSESGYCMRWKVISAAELGAPHRRDRVWIMADRERCGWDRLHEWEQEGHVASDVTEFGADKPDGRAATDPCRKDVANAGEGECRARRPGRSSGMGSRIPEQALPDAERQRLEVVKRKSRDDEQESSAPERDGHRGAWWGTEPALGRVAHGVARRVDRLKALGNGQVPAVVRAAWHLLSGEA